MRFVTKILIIFIFSLIGGIFGAQVIWPYILRNFFHITSYPSTETIIVFQEKNIKQIQKVKELLEAENEKNIEEIKLSIVPVKVQTISKKNIILTGFIISSDGFIIVPDYNNILEGAKIFININEKVYKPIIVKKDLATNLALLKIEETNLKTMPIFSQDKNIFVGKEVFIFFFNEKSELIFQKEEIAFFNPLTSEIRVKSLLKNNPSLAIFDSEGNFLTITSSDLEGNISFFLPQKIKEFVGLK